MTHTSREEFDARIAKVNEIDWARLAAFIDGEGTIMITTSMSAKSQTVGHMLSLIVSGTSPRLIQWLQDTISGRVYIVKASQWKSNAPCYSWRIFEERAEVVLQHCLPYFIIKREQAETALAYRALKRQGSKGRRQSPEVIQQREAFRLQMKALNNFKKADSRNSSLV